MKSMLLAAGLLGVAIAGIVLIATSGKKPAELPAMRGTHAMG